MYTTWDISINSIRQQNSLAAQLLKFLAYLDHRDVWYGLFRGYSGINDSPDATTPVWFARLSESEVLFENAMRTLAKYCLVEAHYDTGSYSVHVCVHDWTLDGLNREIDWNLYWLAFDCVARGVEVSDWNCLSSMRCRRIAAHADRLVQERFRGAVEWGCSLENRLDQIYILAELLRQQAQHEAAEQMYLLALAGYEKALGPDHTSTLDTVNNLGNLYHDQGKLSEAEKMYIRALARKEKVLGPEHTSTLSTVNNLASLYCQQGELGEAEKMYVRALAGKEKAPGLEHPSTLNTVHNLGNLYADQGKLGEAEKMYVRALTGKEKTLGLEHMSTLNTVYSLGTLYTDQGKLVEAEKMYVRALSGYGKVLGPTHKSTLRTVHNLELLYTGQGKLGEAEKIYIQALAGKDTS